MGDEGIRPHRAGSGPNAHQPGHGPCGKTRQEQGNIMKKRNRLILAAAALAAALAITGCSGGGLRGEMIEYMEDKYGEEFTFIDSTGGSLGSSEKQILVSSDRFPGEEILVSHYDDGISDNGTFCDNYMAFEYEDAVLSGFEAAASAVYGNCTVIYEPVAMPLDPDVGPDTSLAEYMSDPASNLSAEIFVSDQQAGDRDAMLESFRGQLQARGLCPGVTLLFVSPDELPGISIENHTDYLREEGLVSMRCDFLLDASYDFVYDDWRE